MFGRFFGCGVGWGSCLGWGRGLGWGDGEFGGVGGGGGGGGGGAGGAGGGGGGAGGGGGCCAGGGLRQDERSLEPAIIASEKSCDIELSKLLLEEHIISQTCYFRHAVVNDIPP